MTNTNNPAAGWYPDPQNPMQQRLWDGATWTDQTRPAMPSGAPAYQRESMNGLAIASMVLGIIWIYWIGSILAVIFGHVALNQTKKNPSQKGRGFAIAGVSLGWAGIGVFILLLIVEIVWELDGGYLY